MSLTGIDTMLYQRPILCVQCIECSVCSDGKRLYSAGCYIKIMNGDSPSGPVLTYRFSGYNKLVDCFGLPSKVFN